MHMCKHNYNYIFNFYYKYLCYIDAVTHTYLPTQAEAGRGQTGLLVCVYR